RAIDLNQRPPLKPVHDLTRLAELCQTQVRAALDAFVDGNVEKAEQVIKNDDLVDSVYHNLFNELIALMMEDPRNIRRANSLLFVAKHLERLGDHATNLADASQGGVAWREVPGYLAAQIAGAYCGVALANGMFGEPVFAASRHARSGGLMALSEFVATFGLLATIWGVSRAKSSAVPFAV